MSNNLIAIDIKFECKDATKALERLKAELKSRTVIMPGIGEYMVNQAKDRISSRKNTAPDGSQWPSLAADTIKAKKKAGKGDKGILVFSERLHDSIGFQVTSDDTVSIGSSMLYAMIHQRGGKAGKGLKVTIPARPYIGLSAEGKRKLESKVVNWIKAILEG